MISPHAHALYQRLLKSGQGTHVSGSSPVQDPGIPVKNEVDSDENGQNGDLAPESRSEQPELLKGMDMGQPGLHPSSQHGDPKAHVGKVHHAMKQNHLGGHPGSLSEKIASHIKSMK